MTSARVLADSLSPAGHRLTTMECTFPRFILAEFNTHRVFSRNSASSRAIPVERVIEQVRENPYIPSTWTSNQPGMTGGEPLTGDAAARATNTWRAAAVYAVQYAEQLFARGVHKQHVNRLLEPFMWHTVIVSSTEWDNFFALRCSPDAQPEMQELAWAMRCAFDGSTPTPVDYGEYHLPLVEPEAEGLAPYDAIAVSVARCARVSYNRHGDQSTLEKDLNLYDRLLASGHLSPFEHVARPQDSRDDGTPGNFTGWIQHRHEVAP